MTLYNVRNNDGCTVATYVGETGCLNAKNDTRYGRYGHGCTVVETDDDGLIDQAILSVDDSLAELLSSERMHFNNYKSEIRWAIDTGRSVDVQYLAENKAAYLADRARIKKYIVDLLTDDRI